MSKGVRCCHRDGNSYNAGHHHERPFGCSFSGEHMDNDNDDLSRREFIGSAIAAGGATSLAMNPVRAEEVGPAIEGAVPVTLRINGKDRQLRVDPRTTLLDCI